MNKLQKKLKKLQEIQNVPGNIQKDPGNIENVPGTFQGFGKIPRKYLQGFKKYSKKF